MGLGAFNHMASITGKGAYADFAFQQYQNLTHGGPAGPKTQPALWDTEAHLYYRDHTFVNHTDSNGKKIFVRAVGGVRLLRRVRVAAHPLSQRQWGRGNGWAIASFAQSLKHLPASHPYAIEYAARLS